MFPIAGGVKVITIITQFRSGIFLSFLPSFASVYDINLSQIGIIGWLFEF
jgi:hypothetical protein